jgi:hypothetical protein
VTRSIARLLAATILGAGLFLMPVQQAAAQEKGNSLAAVRAATAKFHNVQRAVDAGYAPLLACFDQPGMGMGQHYAKLPFGKLNPTQPEALVYEVRGTHLRLVAVEYIVAQAEWHGATPPQLFGHSFQPNNALGIWALHAWIWRSNPLGTFAAYNPRVTMCPGHQTDF